MKKFYYRSMSKTGVKQTGITYAAHRTEALRTLELQFGCLLDLQEENWWNHPMILLQKGTLFQDSEFYLICKQFAFMLQGGLPITDVLRMMQKQHKNQPKSLFFSDALQSLEAGFKFSDSMERWKDRLPRFFIQSVRAGERSGHWELVFRDIAEFYRKETEQKRILLNALIYPALLLTVTLLVCCFLPAIVIPNFLSLYSDTSQLPWATRSLLHAYAFGQRYGFPVVFTIFLVVFIFQRCQMNPKFKVSWSHFLLTRPKLGILLMKKDLARFCRTMALLLTHGLEIDQSIMICSDVLSSPYLLQRFRKIPTRMEQGLCFTQAVEELTICPPDFLMMVQMGESGNCLQEAMLDAANLYDTETQSLLQALQRLIEPSLIILISLVVGFLAYAIMLPMMDQWQGFQQI